MLSRSLLVLGLCAAFGLATPAFADIAKPEKPSAASSKTTNVSDASPSAKAKKKVVAKAGKKNAAKDEAVELTDKEKAKAKLAAAEKVRQAKLMAMRAKAKADADALREASRAPKSDPSDKEKSTKLAKANKPVDDSSAIDVGFKPIKPQSKGLTAERLAAQQAAAVGADVVVQRGNNGELRSEIAPRQNAGFFQILFGDESPAPSSSLLPETRALDSVLEKKKKFRVKPEFEPQEVSFSGYPRGTIVIDTSAHFLYLVESGSSARRYGIAVGREGLQFKGQVKVGDKQEWPRWIPTLDMQKREPKHYGQYKNGMPGGGQNPLGARAIYLYDGGKDTHLRIHGTIAPQSIGTNASNGCFRMINDHVIDLYGRVSTGTPVVIL